MQNFKFYDDKSHVYNKYDNKTAISHLKKDNYKTN